MAGDFAVDGLAVPEHLERLHDLLGRVAEAHPELEPSDLMLFETAVIEIAANVVEHGRPRGRVTWAFRMQVAPDRLTARLCDDGQAFTGTPWRPDMPEPAAEAGRGLPLATAALDGLEYERTGDRNTWTLIRRRR